MTLITRQGKGSRISTQEMDNNMDYLEQNSTINITGITSQIGPFDEDRVNYINKIDITENKTVYKGVLYGEYESPISEIILKYNDSVNNQLDINFEFSDSYYFSGDLIYKRNIDNTDEYEFIRFTSVLEYNPFLNGFFNNFNGGFNTSVNTIQIQPDGKILVGGGVSLRPNGPNDCGIARLNYDGSRDNTFNIGTGFNSIVYSIQIQPDGKILVGGMFIQYDNITSNRIIRLNSDGTVDNTFNIGTGFNSIVYSIQIQPDGKILVGGNFTTYNGTSSPFIRRLNSDGGIDNTFNIGTGFNGDVNTIQIQSDGKILVGGDFTSYNGTTRNRIIRLNSDGSRDDTFSIGTGFNSFVESIEIQSDGKLIVGGGFTSYNGILENRLLRLNSDGSRDNAFNIGTGFNNVVYTTQSSSDGKIFVGGEFSTCDNVTRNKFAVLNSDGSLDNTFIIDFGFFSVYSILLKSDVTLFIGNLGGFQKRVYNYNVYSNTLNPTCFVGNFPMLDVDSEGKLRSLLYNTTEKFILDFNLIQIKN